MGSPDPFTQMEYNLTEAEAEIARHHKAFKEIGDLIDNAFAMNKLPARVHAVALLKRIRNIVG